MAGSFSPNQQHDGYEERAHLVSQKLWTVEPYLEGIKLPSKEVIVLVDWLDRITGHK